MEAQQQWKNSSRRGRGVPLVASSGCKVLCSGDIRGTRTVLLLLTFLIMSHVKSRAESQHLRTSGLSRPVSPQAGIYMTGGCFEVSLAPALTRLYAARHIIQ
jgi:hypothetical protein